MALNIRWRLNFQILTTDDDIDFWGNLHERKLKDYFCGIDVNTFNAICVYVCVYVSVKTLLVVCNRQPKA